MKLKVKQLKAMLADANDEATVWFGTNDGANLPAQAENYIEADVEGIGPCFVLFEQDEDEQHKDADERDDV